MTSREALLNNFLEAIDGEFFLSCGSVDKDYALVAATIDHQGYWAGDKYRYYFNNDLTLKDVEERRFGA